MIQTTTKLICMFLMAVSLATMVGCGMAREDPLIEEDSEKELPDPNVLVKLDPGSYSQTWQMEDGRMVSFAISVPSSISEENAVPVVLSLHYGAERMTQFFGQKMLHGLVKPATAELDPLIIAPDVINKSWTNFRCEECVMALMEQICKTYNVDRDRILVIGFSMGAEGAWHYAAQYPDFFSAAIPLAGRPPSDYLLKEWQVPMLAIHSKTDEVFPYQVVADAVTAIDSRNPGILQIYPLEDVSHYDTQKFITPLTEACGWVKQVWESANKTNQ